MVRRGRWELMNRQKNEMEICELFETHPGVTYNVPRTNTDCVDTPGQLLDAFCEL